MREKTAPADFAVCHRIIDNISHVIVGKTDVLELILAALLGEGHVLLQDVPGVGKTLLAKSLARSIDGVFKRIQFAPDLLPADVTGFTVYNQKKGEFTFQPGPVMTNVLLADEINRTVPRTQASLLECMEERQITVDGTTMALPCPFFVIATQNPIELEGTFPLPEAQLDRFLVKVSLGYPDHGEEMAILERFRLEDPFGELEPVIAPEQIISLQRKRRQIQVAPLVIDYIASIAAATRGHASLLYGASPRASLGLMRTAQALAALRNRDYVLPDDVKHLVVPVLAHRVILQMKERLRGATAESVLKDIIDRTPVPAPVDGA
ncbi:MAG: MoxR family ATPase [Deltaproteobacteria bacterium]|nr:MoxR family ATPase [Deltaproteobacteria bacterium]